VIWPVVFAIFGLYDARRPTDIPRIVNAGLIAVVLVVLVTFATGIDVSRSLVVWLLFISLASVVTGRLVTQWLAHEPPTKRER
jgi:FlaA1/EpsC-like NDP-sugar epimerase